LLNALGVRAPQLATEDVDIARREALAIPGVPAFLEMLRATGQGLPHLAYLLAASQEIPVLSSHGSVMVRVPVPERYAIHKLIGRHMIRAICISC
jgi:hypothetical protein